MGDDHDAAAGLRRGRLDPQARQVVVRPGHQADLAGLKLLGILAQFEQPAEIQRPRRRVGLR